MFITIYARVSKPNTVPNGLIQIKLNLNQIEYLMDMPKSYPLEDGLPGPFCAIHLSSGMVIYANTTVDIILARSN